MTQQILWKRTVVGFYNVRPAGKEEIIATLSPQQMTSLLGMEPVGTYGAAEVKSV